MEKISILIILGLIFAFSFTSGVLAEDQMIEAISISDNSEKHNQVQGDSNIPENCREDIEIAENYAQEQEICTDQFAYMVCPETDFVYGASNGCIISELENLGWSITEKDGERDVVDRPIPISEEIPEDNMNEVDSDELIQENVPEEDLDDIKSALEFAEGRMCTQQVMNMESPETGFVYLARNGCVISSLEDKGWSRAQGRDRLGQIDDLDIMARRELSNQKAGEVREEIKSKEENLNQTITGIDRALRETKRSQNQVSLSVLSLISMENVTSIGKNISTVAREINQSSKESFGYEERIQNRGGFRRFFMGGDNEAAQEIENRVDENKQRIENIRDMIEDNQEIGEQAKQLLKEQLENLEQEQERLRNISQSEKEDRGLFGRLFRR